MEHGIVIIMNDDKSMVLTPCPAEFNSRNHKT